MPPFYIFMQYETKCSPYFCNLTFKQFTFLSLNLHWKIISIRYKIYEIKYLT